MEPKLQSAAYKHIFCRIYIANLVTLATQRSVFIKIYAAKSIPCAPFLRRITQK